MLGGLIAVAAVVASADEPAIPREDVMIVARLEVHTPAVADAADLRVTVVVANEGRTAGDVNATFLGMPSVVLDVRNAEGRPVPKAPPPVPPEDPRAGVRSLGPGETLRVDHTGATLFGMPLAPGRYEIRFRGVLESLEVVSEWRSFTVG